MDGMDIGGSRRCSNTRDCLLPDNGPESAAREFGMRQGRLGTGTLYIEPRSLWENGYCENFNGKLREKCLNGEIFY